MGAVLAMTAWVITGCQKSVEPSALTTSESLVDGKHGQKPPVIEYGRMRDQEGNEYKTVKIGQQVWMAENLRTSVYRNGDRIRKLDGKREWLNQGQKGAWCYYNNNAGHNKVYGKLYNFYAVEDPRGIAPAGWHVPDYSDIVELGDALGGSQVAGGKLKATGTLQAHNGFWQAPNTDASNSSGFTAIPSGARGSNGAFYAQGTMMAFWTTTWWDSNINEDGTFDPFMLIGTLSNGSGTFENAGSDVGYLAYGKANAVAIRLVKDK